jgi:DNA-binding SARP family transcriptional activator
LADALGWWRGAAYADFAEEHWARAERSRLRELRLHAVELHAGARLELGRPAEAVPDLDVHVTEHPWREEGWRLLSLALYRSGRQGEALNVLRRARTILAGQLDIAPGTDAAGRIWAQAAASYRVVRQCAGLQAGGEGGRT